MLTYKCTFCILNDRECEKVKQRMKLFIDTIIGKVDIEKKGSIARWAGIDQLFQNRIRDQMISKIEFKITSVSVVLL